MKAPLKIYSTRKVVSLIMIWFILGISVSWVTAQYTQKEKVENMTPEEAAIEQAKQFFMQTHTEPIDHIYVDCFDASIPSYKLTILYFKWENDSDGDFLFDYRIDYFVESGKIEPGPVAVDTCYSWVIRYVGSQPIISQEQANQTFFTLVKRSPFSNWAIYLGQSALSINITETTDCYEESVMFQYAGVNCPNAKLILSYDIYKNGTAIFIGQREIIP
jgi:hypothetical protein